MILLPGVIPCRKLSIYFNPIVQYFLNLLQPSKNHFNKNHASGIRHIYYNSILISICKYCEASATSMRDFEAKLDGG